MASGHLKRAGAQICKHVGTKSGRESSKSLWVGALSFQAASKSRRAGDKIEYCRLAKLVGQCATHVGWCENQVGECNKCAGRFKQRVCGREMRAGG